MFKELMYLIWALFCFIVMFLVILFNSLTGFFEDGKNKLLDSFIKEVLFRWKKKDLNL